MCLDSYLKGGNEGRLRAQEVAFLRKKLRKNLSKKGSAEFRVILVTEKLFELLCQSKRKAENGNSFPFSAFLLDDLCLSHARGNPK